jgi:hypothetical protein
MRPKKMPSLENPAAATQITACPLAKKKRPHEADAKLLRQVSYRQETYRAVMSLYANLRRNPSLKFDNPS